jgi:hypothetical protein
MPLQIHVSEIQEMLCWRDVFRLLGVRSCHPLLERMGVSSEIAGRPEGLRQAALHFWERDWQGTGLSGYSDPDFEERYRTAIEALIKSTFTIIVDYYGEDAATDLYGWSQRFFVNQYAEGLWSTWSSLLGSLARSQTDSQFQDEVARFASPLQEEFGPETDEADTKALNEIDLAKLSPTEYKMIEMEVTQPGDFVTVDLGDLAGSVIRSNHAYRFWRVLSSSLEPSELDTWLWIGYEQAEHFNMPAEDVELPLLR